MQLFFHERLFVGPLPPPDILRDYGKVHPDLPDRIVTMAENEQKHRHTMESIGMEAGSSSAKRGQVCATLISVLAILSAIPIGIWGNEWAAGAIGTVGIVGYLTPALLPRNKQSTPEMTEE